MHNYLIVFLIGLTLTAIIAIARSDADVATQPATGEPPGLSLGIASVPNLLDLGGYKTSDGKTVARGLSLLQ